VQGTNRPLRSDRGFLFRGRSRFAQDLLHACCCGFFGRNFVPHAGHTFRVSEVLREAETPPPFSPDDGSVPDRDDLVGPFPSNTEGFSVVGILKGVLYWLPVKYTCLQVNPLDKHSDSGFMVGFPPILGQYLGVFRETPVGPGFQAVSRVEDEADLLHGRC